MKVRGTVRRLTLACLATLALFGVSVREVSAEALSLDESVRLALAENPRITRAEYDLRDAEIQLKMLEARGSDAVSRDDLDSARRGLKRAEENLESARHELSMDVKNAFISLSRSQNDIEIKERNLEDVKDELERAKRRVDAGLMAEDDFELSGLELDERKTESALERRKGDYRTEQMSFNRLIGRDMEAKLDEIEVELDYDMRSFDLDESIENALRKRRDVREAREELEESRKKRDEEIDGEAPAIDVEQAEMEVRRRELDLIDVEERAVLEVRDAYHEYRNAKDGIGFAEEVLRRSEKELARAERRHEAGYVSLTEFHSQRRQTEHARFDVLNATYLFVQAKAELRRVSGRPFGPLARLEQK